MTRLLPMTTLIRSASAIALVAVLTACSGGAPTEEAPITQAPPVADYTGPAPANADVQAFKINLWENIKANNRCGGCHNATGQSPRFARNDDVNLAYQEAIGVVDLPQPDNSRMVTKVSGGHNCWLTATSACGDTLTVWIRNWAGAVATGGRQIQLQPPVLRDVGASKNFPASSAGYANTIYPIVTQYCSRCHSESAATPQSPYFASADVDVAYAAARTKINLEDPAQSRLVLRLRDEFHNCWSDCASNANTMEQAIHNFADAIPLTQIDPSLVTSKALTLYEGTIAAGGNRFENNLLALYEFKTGTGNTIYDTSGVEPALNLNMTGDITWVGGWGVNVKTGGKAQGTTAASKKLADTIRLTGEYSIEVWAAPANVMQEDAFMVSYSGGTMARNFTLAQREYQYQAFNRSSTTDTNGEPFMITAAADEDAQASLQHVVLTFDPVNGRRIYVNGEFTGDNDAQTGGSLNDWDDTFAFVLGNETSNDRQWTGVMRLVAIHSRALTLEQIQQNFAAGVGERYYMLFSVSHLINVPQSYIMFEASQYDSYGYLFSKPAFISLDGTAVPDNIPLAGVRLGVNGAEATAGQAYIPLNTTLSSSNYLPETGQPLSQIGTVVALEKGPDLDQFFLTFERIGSNTHTVTEPALVPPPPPADGPPQPQYGLRTFDEINKTFSNITSVPVTNANVAQTYNLVKQALPSTEQLGTFGASQQTALAQLAIEYCNELVDDGTLRGGFFPGLNLNTTANTYFASQANRDLVIDPLIERVVGQFAGSAELGTQPSAAEVRTEINDLIAKLTAGAAGGQSGRTAVVAKASCAAVLGSGSLLLQ
ncbi:MAG: LamG domain-containing protein [Steroidobacteraceae bacterium]